MFDLDRFVRQTQEAYSHYASCRKVQISFDNRAENPQVAEDQDWAKSKLDSALLKAVDSAAPGSTIQLKLLPEGKDLVLQIVNVAADVQSGNHHPVFSTDAQSGVKYNKREESGQGPPTVTVELRFSSAGSAG